MALVTFVECNISPTKVSGYPRPLPLPTRHSAPHFPIQVSPYVFLSHSLTQSDSIFFADQT